MVTMTHDAITYTVATITDAEEGLRLLGEALISLKADGRLDYGEFANMFGAVSIIESLLHNPVA